MRKPKLSIRTTKPALDDEAELRVYVEHFLVIARELPDLDVSARIDVIEHTAAFLVELLLPHTAVEQRVLYPRAATLLGEPDDSGTVGEDRAAVVTLLKRLATADAPHAGALPQTPFFRYALPLPPSCR